MRKDPQHSVLGFCIKIIRQHLSDRSNKPAKILAFTSDLGFASSNFKPLLNVLNISPSAAILVPRFHVAFEPLRDTTPYTESYTRPQVTRKEIHLEMLVLTTLVVGQCKRLFPALFRPGSDLASALEDGRC